LFYLYFGCGGRI